jgi:D-alanyl-D-alanine carboxypeptidase
VAVVQRQVGTSRSSGHVALLFVNRTCSYFVLKAKKSMRFPRAPAQQMVDPQNRVRVIRDGVDAGSWSSHVRSAPRAANNRLRTACREEPCLDGSVGVAGLRML